MNNYNRVYRQATAYIILCPKHDSLRKLKSLLEFCWNTKEFKCSICGK